MDLSPHIWVLWVWISAQHFLSPLFLCVAYISFRCTCLCLVIDLCEVIWWWWEGNIHKKKKTPWKLVVTKSSVGAQVLSGSAIILPMQAVLLSRVNAHRYSSLSTCSFFTKSFCALYALKLNYIKTSCGSYALTSKWTATLITALWLKEWMLLNLCIWNHSKEQGEGSFCELAFSNILVLVGDFFLLCWCQERNRIPVKFCIVRMIFWDRGPYPVYSTFIYIYL